MCPFAVYYRDANGKKASRKLGNAQYLTVAQARQMVRELGGKVASGESIRKERPNDRLTLGSLFEDHYFPYIRRELKGYAEQERALTINFGDYSKLPIEDITPILIDKWRSKCHESGLKAASVNRYTSCLRAAFNYAVRIGLIDKNPIARLSPLKERDSKQVVRFLQPDERERLEKALEKREDRIRSERESANQWRRERGYKVKRDKKGEFVDYLKPLVLLSLCTSIRRGALLALLWSDIDFSTQTVTLRSADDKTGKTHRLPLSDDAIDILSSWRKQSEDATPDSYVFPNPKTGGSLQAVKTSWKNLLEDAKIENFRWHDMRHDFASQLVMKGVDLNTVRELLCHSDMKMTMKYAHLAPQSKLNAVQVLNRRVKGSKVIGRIRKVSG